MLKYETADGDISVLFLGEVLAHLKSHRQITPKDKEAGGQLFARFDGDIVYIEEATGPRTTDLRTRFGFKPDRKAEQKEILELFERGLHYVGDWHTHPTDTPQPSGEDIASIRRTVNLSQHELKGFLLLIVGNAPFPNGLYVSLHTGETNRVLTSTEKGLPS